MHKRTVTSSSVGMYWVWEMPEIAKEIPALFREVGTARILRTRLLGVNVAVRLNQPARVVDWRFESGDGIAINSNTQVCIGYQPLIYVDNLPRNGDTIIQLSIELCLHTFKIDEEVTLEDMRQRLKDFANAMTRTWFYHFD